MVMVVNLVFGPVVYYLVVPLLVPLSWAPHTANLQIHWYICCFTLPDLLGVAGFRAAGFMAMASGLDLLGVLRRSSWRWGKTICDPPLNRHPIFWMAFQIDFRDSERPPWHVRANAFFAGLASIVRCGCRPWRGWQLLPQIPLTRYWPLAPRRI